jgi:hypothetical protein
MGKVSYLSVPVEVTVQKTMEYRVVGPSDTEPTPAEGYNIDPEFIEISGVDGKFWIEYRILD